MIENLPHRTELSELGEFGLINYLTNSIQIKNPSSIKGVGDDAAVLAYGDKQTLVTTDLLIEGVHFDLTYVPLKHLGYKTAVVNFSDIVAMNGNSPWKCLKIKVMKPIFLGLVISTSGARRNPAIYAEKISRGIRRPSK